MKVAICISGNNSHSINWKDQWIDYCRYKNIEFELVDAYDSNIIANLKKYDVLLWHFSNYVLQDMLFARGIIYSAQNMGLKVFPGFNDSWHFDDKVVETYLLQSIDAPIPDSIIGLSLSNSLLSIRDIKNYPIVAKLRNGAGSHNVKLLNSKEEAEEYSELMFSKGLRSSPDPGYKAISNLRSLKSIGQFWQRFIRIPEFIKTWKNSNEFALEKGYVLFQEFIPNDGYDLKVVVVGDKLSYVARKIRNNDFRASGGGDLFYDRSLISESIREIAFSVSDKLGFKCMGYDFVVNKDNDEARIIEMSYGFSHKAILGAQGYFNREGTWFDRPLNVPSEILENILK